MLNILDRFTHPSQPKLSDLINSARYSIDRHDELRLNYKGMPLSQMDLDVLSTFVRCSNEAVQLLLSARNMVARKLGYHDSFLSRLDALAARDAEASIRMHTDKHCYFNHCNCEFSACLANCNKQFTGIAKNVHYYWAIHAIDRHNLENSGAAGHSSIHLPRE